LNSRRNETEERLDELRKFRKNLMLMDELIEQELQYIRKLSESIQNNKHFYFTSIILPIAFIFSIYFRKRNDVSLSVK